MDAFEPNGKRELPAPITPPDCDLRDFEFMPLDIVRLFGSRFHAIANDSEWRAGVTLWLKSFHQVPAASLPDDDIELCRLAELGRDQTEWQRVKANALYGWIRCADGRLYHPTVAEKVNEAWCAKQVQRERSRKGNAARWGQKKRAPSKANGAVPKGSRKESLKDRKGQGQGQCKEQRDSSSLRSEESPPPHPPKGRGGGGRSKIDLGWLRERLAETLARIECNRTTAGFANWAPLLALLDPPHGEPCDWASDVVPAIEAAAASCSTAGDPLRAWTHPAIARVAIDNRNRRLSGLPPVTAPAVRNGKPAPRDLEIPDWMQRLAAGGAA